MQGDSRCSRRCSYPDYKTIYAYTTLAQHYRPNAWVAIEISDILSGGVGLLLGERHPRALQEIDVPGKRTEYNVWQRGSRIRSGLGDRVGGLKESDSVDNSEVEISVKWWPFL